MKKITTYIAILTALLMCGCTDDLLENEDAGAEEVVQKDVVCLSAGSEMLDNTRAGKVSYMPNGVRFTSMMLFKESDSEGVDYKYETPINAYMLVENRGDGNSLYYQSDYRNPGLNIDDYRNDQDASIFYWQNRLYHAFIGYVDDYHQALAGANTEPNTYIPQPIDWDISAPKNAEGKVDPAVTNFMYKLKKDGTIYSWQQYESFDLKRGSQMTVMTDQPDPLIACEEEQPKYSSAEKNRVYLTFRHQFAQVQVNLKANLESVTLQEEQIKGVELLGVAETAYVFPYPEYGYNETTDTWSIVRQGSAKKLLRVPEFETITIDKIENCPPHGTAFDMFPMDAPKVATGYIKGFEAIAFGNLPALRIRWQETESEGGVMHEIVFNITDPKFNKLESGKRYIFNLELRRGTLAVINADIIDWIPYEKTDCSDHSGGEIYETNGTVKPKTE